MKALLKFELYKIFSQKSVLIVFALILLVLSTLTLYSTFSSSFYYGKQEMISAYKQVEGKLSKEKYERQEQEFESRTKKSSSKEDLAYGSALIETMSEYEDIEYYDNLISRIEQDLTIATGFNYESLLLQKLMLEQIDLNETYFHKGPEKMMDYVSAFGYMITGILILIGLSSIFSNEDVTGMDQLILSSKNGRNKLVSAKIITAVFFVISIIGVQLLYNWGIYSFLYGNDGWLVPLQKSSSFMLSPYSLNLFEYFSIQMILHTLFSIGFAIFVLLISNLCKNNYHSIIISSVVFVAPMMLSFFNLIQMSNVVQVAKFIQIDTIIQYSYTYLMKVDVLFNRFKVFNFFESPVLGSIAIPTVFVLTTLFFTWLLYRTYERKEVI
ncbi:hypothetical protein [Chengkuizengella axinellae]|uniref:ABC transporter permease n=1 Tax=Chengkuizengella axinellae TaxID=3064388 RepID=A0ABT9IZD4_9BACL|nr:hypothetical protein [Chengkuizengella sp. 2205SS18-9]MDP5274140.1 hypothetical protein [Chengkuizengella sp. 2205SS18-9]